MIIGSGFCPFLITHHSSLMTALAVCHAGVWPFGLCLFLVTHHSSLLLQCITPGLALVPRPLRCHPEPCEDLALRPFPPFGLYLILVTHHSTLLDLKVNANSLRFLRQPAFRAKKPTNYRLFSLNLHIF
jgi:hypothetical protein